MHGRDAVNESADLFRLSFSYDAAKMYLMNGKCFFLSYIVSLGTVRSEQPLLARVFLYREGPIVVLLSIFLVLLKTHLLL